MRELTEIYEELHGLTKVDMQSRVKAELRWYTVLKNKILTGRPGPRPDLEPRVGELDRLDNGLATRNQRESHCENSLGSTSLQWPRLNHHNGKGGIIASWSRTS